MQLLVTASFPESNPTLIEQKDKQFPLGLQLALKDEEPEILMVSPEGWAWKGTGTDWEVVPLSRDYSTDSSVVLLFFLAQYIRYWLGTILPDTSTIQMGVVANHIGEGTRDYELLNNFLRFVLMVRDGVLNDDEDGEVTGPQQFAQGLLNWLSGNN